MTITSGSFHIANATASDLSSLNQALAYLSKSPTGASILNAAANGQTTISIIHNGNDAYDPISNTIYWDPEAASTVLSSLTSGSTGVQSAALGLVHEAAHATDPNFSSNFNTTNATYGNQEEYYAVQKEDIVATDLGEPLRYNHSGLLVLEFDSTEHTTTANNWQGTTLTGAPQVEGTFQPGTVPTIAPRTSGDGTGTEIIDGSNITITTDPGRTLSIQGTNDNIYDSNATINLVSGGLKENFLGSNLSVFSPSDNTIDFLGTHDTAWGNGLKLVLDNSQSSVILDGNDCTVYGPLNSSGVVGNGGIIDIYGTRDIANLWSGTLNVDTNGATCTLNGGWDRVNDNGTHVLVDADGSRISVEGNSTDATDFSGGLYTDDTGPDATDVSGTPTADDSGGYGYGYGYDFAKGSKPKVSQGIETIAQYDAARIGILPANTPAQARMQALESAEASADGTSTAATDFEGAHWNAGNTITWSLASGPQFSSSLDSQEEAVVQQAFQTWAVASGLTFEEVSNSQQADIEVGFGTLNTPSTSELGLTSYRTQAGQFLPQGCSVLSMWSRMPWCGRS